MKTRRVRNGVRERVARTVARPGELVKRRWRAAQTSLSLKVWARSILRSIAPGDDLGAVRDSLAGWLKRKGCRP